MRATTGHEEARKELRGVGEKGIVDEEQKKKAGRRERQQSKRTKEERAKTHEARYASEPPRCPLSLAGCTSVPSRASSLAA